MTDRPSKGDDSAIPHPGGEWIKLRLTALEQDVLYHFIMDYQDQTDEAYALVLNKILNRLPEQDILTREPSMETLIETGYLDGPLAEFDAPPVVDSPGDQRD